MNKEEILNEITKTKEYLANLEKMLKEYNYERWKPKDNEKFWYIDSFGCVNYSLFMSETKIRFKNYNCFQTREQAKQEAENILIRRQLEDIARRLNKGIKINWDNEEQDKYFIRFSYWSAVIQLECAWKYKLQGVIYCRDEKFLDVAIEEIGKERLENYLRGE